MPHSDPRPEQAQAPRSNLSPANSKASLLAAVALAGAGLAVWALRDRAGPAPAQAALPAAPAAEKSPAPAVPAHPPVAAADAQVRSALGALTALAPWLATEDLARRFVAAVHAVAEGRSPRASLSFLEVKGEFHAARRKGRTVAAPRSQARYDFAGQVFEALDAAECARAYRALQPLLESAHAEIGQPGTRFEEVFAQAIAHLLATPVLAAEAELVPVPGGFEYAEERLEKLTPAQKHLLRMGPGNVRKVQGKLREIARELNLVPVQPM